MRFPWSSTAFPTRPFSARLSVENRGLLDSLKGRPALIFATDIAHGADNSMGRLVARLQKEYFYWFTWAGLLSGEAEPGMIRTMHAQSPFSL